VILVVELERFFDFVAAPPEERDAKKSLAATPLRTTLRLRRIRF